MFRQIDRAHRAFTPNQVEFLANIVRLYRGEDIETIDGSDALLMENFPDGPPKVGDEVEILTSKAQTAPPAAWESIVVTGKARAAIRRATRAAVRAQYADLGRRIVERLFARAKKEYSDEKLQGALPRLARATISSA